MKRPKKPGSTPYDHRKGYHRKRGRRAESRQQRCSMLSTNRNCARSSTVRQSKQSKTHQVRYLATLKHDRRVGGEHLPSSQKRRGCRGV
eukprot:899069-Amphidinium_carterae.1